MLAAQQLGVSPFPAEVGSRVTVSASRLQKDPTGKNPATTVPLAGLPIDVELPDHAHRQVGATDAAGEVEFVPTQLGTHVFSTTIDGVRVVAPHRVISPAPRWLPALVCVPLGLALLWRHLRRRA